MISKYLDGESCRIQYKMPYSFHILNKKFFSYNHLWYLCYFGFLLQLAICPAKLLCSLKAIALPFAIKPVLYILFIVSIIHNSCRVWAVVWKYLFNILCPQQSYSPICSYSTLSSLEIIPWLVCWCGAFPYRASLHWWRGMYFWV